MEDSNKVLYDILLERLELLRALDKEGDSDHRRHIANETADLHAPLAHRLGLYQIKTEMEDLALKFTDYTKYKYIAHELAAKKNRTRRIHRLVHHAAGEETEGRRIRVHHQGTTQIHPLNLPQDAGAAL